MRKISSVSKIAMLAIVFILLLGISSFAATNRVRRIYYYRTLGDMDGNGTVDPGDARIIMRASVSLEHLSFEQQNIADINRNGVVDPDDASLAMKGQIKTKIMISYIPGDLNKDCKIDFSDLRLLDRYLSGLEKFNLYKKAIADVNCDGVIDSKDSRLLMRKAMSFIDALPAEGDITGNGTISKKDANLVLQYSVKKVKLTDAQKVIADVNRDGKITSADARIIERRAAGLE